MWNVIGSLKVMIGSAAGGAGTPGAPLGQEQAHQAIAQIFAGHNGDTHLAKILIVAGVIAVEVRINDELDREGGNFADGGDDLLSQRGKLIVHHKNPIGPVSTPIMPPWPSSV
jgi:hypothetical protein